MTTNNDIQKKFKNLPQDLRDAILSVDTANIIQSIAKKHVLTIDKMGKLADEIGLLMLGITHPKNFISNLEKKLGINSETIKKITEEINIQIFAKVRRSLKRIHELEEEKIKEKKESVVPIPKSESPVPSPQPPVPSPFEEKLQDKVFKIETPIKKEVEQAKKESRYPANADPYREPIE